MTCEPNFGRQGQWKRLCGLYSLDCPPFATMPVRCSYGVEHAAASSAAARRASTVDGKAGYVCTYTFHPTSDTKHVCKCGHNQADPQKHKQHLDILICGAIRTLPHLTMPMRLYKFTYEFDIQHPGVLTIESQLRGLLVTLATIAYVDLTIQRRTRGLLHPADS